MQHEHLPSLVARALVPRVQLPQLVLDYSAVVDGVAEDHDAVVPHVAEHPVLEVPSEGKHLLPHHGSVLLLALHIVQPLRRAIHEHMLAVGAHPVQAGARVPLQALAGRLAAWLRHRRHGGQHLEVVQLLPRQLGERRGHEDELRARGQLAQEVIHREVGLILQEHVHLIQNHSLAVAEVQSLIRVLIHQELEPTRRGDQDVGACSELLLLRVQLVAAGAAVDAEAAPAARGDDAGDADDLVYQVGGGRQDQQPQLVILHPASRAAVAFGDDVALEQGKQVRQGLARASLVRNHRAAALHDVVVGEVLNPRRPRQVQEVRKVSHVRGDAVHIAPRLLGEEEVRRPVGTLLIIRSFPEVGEEDRTLVLRHHVPGLLLQLGCAPARRLPALVGKHRGLGQHLMHGLLGLAPLHQRTVCAGVQLVPEVLHHGPVQGSDLRPGRIHHLLAVSAAAALGVLAALRPAAPAARVGRSRLHGRRPGLSPLRDAACQASRRGREPHAQQPRRPEELVLSLPRGRRASEGLSPSGTQPLGHRRGLRQPRQHSRYRRSNCGAGGHG
mmetsp:Transcript_54088/g.139281  ORF Transcript_54088/g.139281 Transcript_54088/m.139281 type:complete len:556 (+) Transcript_54088:422-2089(+)